MAAQCWRSALCRVGPGDAVALSYPLGDVPSFQFLLGCSQMQLPEINSVSTLRTLFRFSWTSLEPPNEGLGSSGGTVYLHVIPMRFATTAWIETWSTGPSDWILCACVFWHYSWAIDAELVIWQAQFIG